MLTREQMYKKYNESNIFNNNPNPNTYISVNVNVGTKAPKKEDNNRQNFSNTRQDVFNVAKETRIRRQKIDEPIQPQRTNQSAEKRRQAYDKLYSSDIFNASQGRIGSSEHRGFGKLRKGGSQRNISTFMDDMKNNEEYVRNLKDYEGQHRVAKKEFNPEIYINRETPEERYYRDHYDMHGTVVLPESNYESQKNNESINRANYALNKRLLNKEIKKYNDCGADKKHPGGNSILYPEGEDLTNKFGKKKFDWMDKSKNDYHYVDPRDCRNNCQINKQIHLSSNVFQNEPNGNFDDNIAEINNRIEIEKKKVYNFDVLGNPIKKINKRDITNNDRSLLGAVHTKWRQTNLDWKSPEAEIMFGKEFNDGINKNYGPNGPTAFQRKINQLADTKNIDTISGKKNAVPITNIQKPLKDSEINSSSTQQVDQMLSNIPNLNEGQKLGIKMKISSLDCKDDQDWENKAKTMSDFYTNNPNGIKKEKQKVTEKVNSRKLSNPNNLNKIDYHDYVISYGTKGNQFEKYDENDIKKMFGTKGVQVYDIQKNPFDKGDYNTVKFKVRYDENNSDKVNKKIKDVEEDLNRKNFRLKIEKEAEKNFNKNERKLINNPGAKIAIMNDDTSNDKNEKYKVIPKNIRQKKGFSKQFANMNYQYKKANP